MFELRMNFLLFFVNIFYKVYVFIEGGALSCYNRLEDILRTTNGKGIERGKRMNIQQIKYAVEIARLGSINRAADELYIGQPNLSRYIRELESELGISIFRRTNKGVVPTPEGETFLRYGQHILNQIDDLEKIYKGDVRPKKNFSISVPRASYVADAFVQFSRNIGPDSAEIRYMETSPRQALKNVLEFDYHLGIIRYAVEDDDYYKNLLESKALVNVLSADFTYVLVMSKNSPLAVKPELCHSDLSSFIELGHGDPFVRSMTPDASQRRDPESSSERSILLYEWGGQFDILCENTDAYMWVSPLPEKLLKRYDLVQRLCDDKHPRYRDVLIHRKDYKLTDLDKQFIAELKRSVKQTLR